MHKYLFCDWLQFIILRHSDCGIRVTA